MSDKSITDLITDNIVDLLGVNPEQVTPESRIVQDLGADSLDEVELVMALEEEFDIRVSAADAEKLKTVSEVIDYVTTRLG